MQYSMSSQIQMIMGVSVGIFILPPDLVQKRRMTVGFAVFLCIAFLPAIKSVPLANPRHTLSRQRDQIDRGSSYCMASATNHLTPWQQFWKEPASKGSVVH